MSFNYVVKRVSSCPYSFTSILVKFYLLFLNRMFIQLFLKRSFSVFGKGGQGLIGNSDLYIKQINNGFQFPRTKVPGRECESVSGRRNKQKPFLDLWKSENNPQTDLGNFTTLKAFKED